MLGRETTRYWLLETRGRCLPSFAVGCVVVGGLTLAVPSSVPVLYRSLTADPWQLLWAFPACFMTLVLDPARDHMEAALFRRPWRRRLFGLGLANAIVVGLVVLSATSEGRAATPALTGLFTLESLVLVTTTFLGRVPAAMLSSSFLLMNWVFGLNEATWEPYPWALLMSHADPLRMSAAAGALAFAVFCWVWRGSRR